MDALGVIVAGTGAVLLYCAYKNESPVALFKSILTNTPPKSSVPLGQTSALTTPSAGGGLGSLPAVAA